MRRRSAVHSDPDPDGPAGAAVDVRSARPDALRRRLPARTGANPGGAGAGPDVSREPAGAYRHALSLLGRRAASFLDEEHDDPPRHDLAGLDRKSPLRLGQHTAVQGRPVSDLRTGGARRQRPRDCWRDGGEGGSQDGGGVAVPRYPVN